MYPQNPGILWYTQDYPRIPPAIDYSGKVSLESWDTLVYSGLSQDSTSYELCFLVIYCCTYMNIYKRSLHTYVHICPIAMCFGC